MSEPTEIKIPVPWGHISGKWWGPRDQPPVIGLHGWQDNAGTFDNLAPLLPSQVALLALDMPGHGFSSSLHHGQFYYHWWDSLQVVRRVVRHLGLERVSLMGHSRGGSVAFLYAATYPDEVDKLICIDNAFPKLTPPDRVAEDTRENVDKLLKYESFNASDVRCYGEELMLDIAHDAYRGSVTRESCRVLLRRGMLESETQPGKFYFTRDPKIKLSGLGVFSKDLVLAYAKKITCEYLNIRVVPGISFAYSDLYDQVLDIIKENSKHFERHKVSGTHHVHLNDAASVAGIISKFLTSTCFHNH